MNVGYIGSVKAMAEEATETAATTKAEATKGDQQAIRKLARQRAANNTQGAQQPANIAPNVRGGLNVKA
jgi:hypothetical protein